MAFEVFEAWREKVGGGEANGVFWSGRGVGLGVNFPDHWGAKAPPWLISEGFAELLRARVSTMAQLKGSKWSGGHRGERGRPPLASPGRRWPVKPGIAWLYLIWSSENRNNKNCIQGGQTINTWCSRSVHSPPLNLCLSEGLGQRHSKLWRRWSFLTVWILITWFPLCNQFVNYEYLHKSFLNREYTAKCKIDENSNLSMENKRRTNFFAKVICGAKIILFVSLFINKTLKITFCLTTKNSVVLLREGFTVCWKTSSWHLFSLHSNALKPQATAAFLPCSFFLPLANFFLLEFF